MIDYPEISFETVYLLKSKTPEKKMKVGKPGKLAK